MIGQFSKNLLVQWLIVCDRLAFWENGSPRIWW